MPVRPSAQVAARVGLWALVGLGAVGGLVGLLRPAEQPAAQDASGSENTALPPEMAGFAELAVTTWLEASSDEDDEAVAALFLADPSTAAGDSGQRRVGDTATVAARPVGDDYWAVTVAAAVSERGSDEQWRPAGTWYLEIGVLADEAGALAAVAEPSVVPAPTSPEDPPRVAGGGMGVPSNDDEEMASTVEGFLAALVAGDGDVSRYLAPDVEIVPVTPAPFQEVTLLRWSVTELTDTEVRVRLAARGTSPGGVPRTLSYELGLAERAGRWEVVSLAGAPTLEEEGTGAAADQSTTTTEAAESTTTASISSAPGA